jgi:biotin synthase
VQKIQEILDNQDFSSENIVKLLESKDDDRKLLFETSKKIKEEEIGNIVHFRGLIELSNICAKDCFYCGIRKSNNNFSRYNIDDEQVLKAAEFAYKENYGSLVIQSGEIEGEKFTSRIENLLREIKKLSNNKLGITISLGEQTPEVYKRWFDAGAHRYLLRIEASNKTVFNKIHPNDENHNFERRVDCLKSLKEIGYQTGTGVMVGLPFQTLEDLAKDIIFMHNLDIDMCGMGPYIEHPDTPLFEFRNTLLPLEERFDLTLKMIAVLRIVMKDINIASATALQAIDPLGREKALKIGANIIMPNITPEKYRDDYSLYTNKPCTDEEPEQCKACLDARISISGNEIGWNKWGDSKRYKKRNKL